MTRRLAVATVATMIIHLDGVAHAQTTEGAPQPPGEAGVIDQMFEWAGYAPVETVREREDAVEEREAAVEEREAAVEEREAAVEEREAAVEEREAEAELTRARADMERRRRRQGTGRCTGASRGRTTT